MKIELKEFKKEFVIKGYKKTPVISAWGRTDGIRITDYFEKVLKVKDKKIKEQQHTIDLFTLEILNLRKKLIKLKNTPQVRRYNEGLAKVAKMEKKFGKLVNCGLMIETIQGYLDSLIDGEICGKDGNEILLEVVDHLNTLNRMLLNLHKRVK